MLSLVRRLAALRAETPALQGGAQRMLDAGPDVLAWERTGGGERLLVAVNFSDAPRPLPFAGERLLSTGPDRAVGGALAGSEGVLIRAIRR
jgi:glycosidase